MVLEDSNPFKINIYNNKGVIGKDNSKDLNNKYSCSSFKEYNSLRIRISGELLIDKWYCTFDPGCEVLDQNNPLQINISLIKLR